MVWPLLVSKDQCSKFCAFSVYAIVWLVWTTLCIQFSHGPCTTFTPPPPLCNLLGRACEREEGGGGGDAARPCRSPTSMYTLSDETRMRANTRETSPFPPSAAPGSYRRNDKFAAED